MYLIPLNQLESVELVIHALKMAAGEADCTSCPAHRVCMKQCLGVAAGIERLLEDELLPALDQPGENEKPASAQTKETSAGPPHLKRIK